MLAVAPGPPPVRRRRRGGGPGRRTEPQRQAGEALARAGLPARSARAAWKRPLGGLRLRSDAWVNERERAYADLFEPARPGRRAPLHFLTTFPDGAAALTANHVRRRTGPGGEVAGLPGAALDQVVEIHRRTVARLSVAHGDPLFCL